MNTTRRQRWRRSNAVPPLDEKVVANVIDGMGRETLIRYPQDEEGDEDDDDSSYSSYSRLGKCTTTTTTTSTSSLPPLPWSIKNVLDSVPLRPFAKPKLALPRVHPRTSKSSLLGSNKKKTFLFATLYELTKRKEEKQTFCRIFRSALREMSLLYFLRDLTKIYFCSRYSNGAGGRRQRRGSDFSLSTLKAHRGSLMGLRFGIRRLTALVTTIGLFTTLLFMGVPFYVGDATAIISYDNGQQQQQQQQRQESRHHRYLLMATAGGKLLLLLLLLHPFILSPSCTNLIVA